MLNQYIMTTKEIGKINSLTSDWLYHEQEIRRGSDQKYHSGQQAKDEKLLLEIMADVLNNNPKG